MIWFYQSVLLTPRNTPCNPYQVHALQVIRILEVSRIMFKKLVKLVDKSCFFIYISILRQTGVSSHLFFASFNLKKWREINFGRFQNFTLLNQFSSKVMKMRNLIRFAVRFLWGVSYSHVQLSHGSFSKYSSMMVSSTEKDQWEIFSANRQTKRNNLCDVNSEEL
jgi:hypothetical protein